ncbi:hypothetical protein KUCAC02_025013 [Chaenocephalus aceratus]|nr:hypothetical protein KUCAC02_025013 [Chaenocephalus aceratus]
MKMADEGRRGEEDGGPGAAHQVFVVMESLLEKLKVLNYEEEILAKHNMKNLSDDPHGSRVTEIQSH